VPQKHQDHTGKEKSMKCCTWNGKPKHETCSTQIHTQQHRRKTTN